MPLAMLKSFPLKIMALAWLAAAAAKQKSKGELVDAELHDAYSVNTPEGHKKLYNSWADTYDAGFAERSGYVYPQNVVSIFKSELGWRLLIPWSKRAPSLDVGAGTGIAGEFMEGMTVDGLDISEAMLQKAAAKKVYRRTIVADLTQPLNMISNGTYANIISVGTFTLGHVGPGCLPELLRIARPGALFVLGMNDRYFDTIRMGSAFATLVAARAISQVDFRNVPMYAYSGTDKHPHAEDSAFVAVFRKL